MSAGRVCLLIAGLAAIALGVACVRVEQTRCSTRLLSLDSKWVELRREWWGLQTRAARLRSPQRIHDRIDYLQTDLVGPAAVPETGTPVRLASDRAQD